MTELQPMLASLASFLPEPLTVVDVGCRWGPDELWRALPNVRLLGFDPDAAECERLNQSAGPLTRFVPIALGASAGTAELHLAAEPACSSLFPPDAELAKDRPGLALITEVGREEIQIDALDSWAQREGVGRADFLKIDTQGSGLEVLKGAGAALETAAVVEIEVEFNPIYLGQSLFGEVDTLLRKSGFVLWRMANLTHYGLPNGSSAFETTETHWFDHPDPATFSGQGGQLFWANAFYVKRHIAFGGSCNGWQECLRDAVVTGGLGFWDLSARAAAGAVEGAPADLAAKLQSFVAAPAGPPAPVPEAAPASPPPVRVSDTPDGGTVLRTYEIGDFAAEVGARLGQVLSERTHRERVSAIQEATLKPALPDRLASPASIGSRRVTRRIQLPSGPAFEIIVDPELDDWKTAAYLAGEGHMVDAALVDLVLNLAGPGEVMLDLGAFIGGIALPAAAAGCTVVAVEPWSHTAALLRASATANGFSNLKVLRAAVTEEAGMTDFFAAGLYGRIASAGDEPVVAVPTVRIDDLVTELGSPQVRLMRIDVEGAEPRVMDGMAGLLTGPNPPKVLFEADEVALRRNGFTSRKLFARFDELEYRLYEVGDHTLTLLRPSDRAVPPVVDCLAVKGLPPAVPGWKLIGDPES
ncbi:hypothetical protein BH23ACT12_BH23ACT12_00130 [soil metagenome]